MSGTPAPAAAPAADNKAKSPPDPKLVFLMILAVAFGLYILGGALNEFLSQFGLGLSNFAIRAGNGANAMDSVFRMFFKISLAAATLAIPYYCFRMVSLIKEVVKELKTAPPHTTP